MTRAAISVLMITCPAFVVLLAVAAATAEAPKQPSTAADKAKLEKAAGSDAEEPARRAAEKVVGQISVEVLIDDKWTKAERIEAAFLFYVHPLSNHVRGSLWGWGRKGRPVAVMEMWQYGDDRTEWGYAVCNTSGGKVRAKYAGAPWWRENDSATELKDIPGAPAPAAQSSPRQRQTKLLAQKCTAHEFWEPNNTRYELRRLERPVCTYQDEAKGVLDGGLFVLANGTNPEMLLFVEARADPKGKGKPAWQYAIGRSAHAELHLEYGGKEVFEGPRGYELTGANRPYWLGYISKAPGFEQGK